jgi:hypothetical protein
MRCTAATYNSPLGCIFICVPEWFGIEIDCIATREARVQSNRRYEVSDSIEASEVIRSITITNVAGHKAEV